MGRILFLTACVNPNGMAYTALSNTNIRLEQYQNALKWYLDNTSFPILIVENTGYDFSCDFKHHVESGRLMCLTFAGNDFDRSLGKGYGEAKIMEYGFSHASDFLKDKTIVKLTGRLTCANINEIMATANKELTVYADICNDDWGGIISSSTLVVAPTAFWTDYFLKGAEKLNDSKRYHFEHLLWDSIKLWKSMGRKHREFSIYPIMQGVSGTSGTPIPPPSKGTKIKYHLMHFLHRYFNYYGYLNPFYHGNPNFEIKR